MYVFVSNHNNYSVLITTMYLSTNELVLISLKHPKLLIILEFHRQPKLN